MNNQELYDSLLVELSEKLNILPDKQEEAPENTLKALWSLAKGKPVSAERARDYVPESLTDKEQEKLKGCIQSRLAGVPLAHISERQCFLGLELLAGPEALIPRKETELLASTAIDVLRERISGELAHVIDVCTGAGNVAMAIASQIEHAKVYVADISEDAVVLARRNCELLGLCDRVQLHSGDLLEPFRELQLNNKVDIITCNPPYISSAKVPAMADEIAGHEPQMAFDGGIFGVNLMRRLISETPDFLTSGGYLVFEVGLGQGPPLQKQMSKMPEYSTVETVQDVEGNARVIVARAN